jgi:hypothetical protein
MRSLDVSNYWVDQFATELLTALPTTKESPGWLRSRGLLRASLTAFASVLTASSEIEDF